MKRAVRSEAVSIGVVSDTHGLLRAAVLHRFARVSLIVHAGDVGKAEVLAGLGSVATLYAVRGNNDHGPWANALPPTLTIAAGGARIHVLHDLHDLAADPVAEGFDVVISGHSHKPSIQHRGGVLFVNPGSAGPRRFDLPIACALLTVRDGRTKARIIELAKG